MEFSFWKLLKLRIEASKRHSSVGFQGQCFWCRQRLVETTGIFKIFWFWDLKQTSKYGILMELWKEIIPNMVQKWPRPMINYSQSHAYVLSNGEFSCYLAFSHNLELDSLTKAYSNKVYFMRKMALKHMLDLKWLQVEVLLFT